MSFKNAGRERRQIELYDKFMLNRPTKEWVPIDDFFSKEVLGNDGEGIYQTFNKFNEINKQNKKALISMEEFEG